MSEKHLYITIDTEMDANKKWKKMWPPEYTSIYEGIPNFFRPLWNRYSVHPVYFLSPEILLDDRCCEILKSELRAGAIIGAHLHPEYIEPEMMYESGRQTKRSLFPCSDCTDELEQEKLKNLTLKIEKRFGIKPVWYRAARFGADENTYRILNSLGYKYDSSVTPGIDWSDRGGINYRGFPKKSYRINNTGLREMPVTIMGKRGSVIGAVLPDNWLFYRWLRPTHMSLMEMKRILVEAEKNGNNEPVMMFHSMEIMINKTPYVRNKFMQRYYLWRLERFLAYAKERGYEM